MKTSSLSSFWKYFLPAGIWTLLIGIVSWRAPALNFPEELLDLITIDKAAHMSVYAMMCGLYLWGFWKIGKKIGLHPVGWLVITACSIYGLIMEILQYYFFPGRYFEFLDIVANISGAFGGYLLFKVLQNHLLTRKN